MEIILTEESHNHVDWEVRLPLVWMEVGLVIGVLLVALVAIPSPSSRRWVIFGGAAASLVSIGALLAIASPGVDRGHLERLPEGGDLRRARVWPIVGTRVVLDVGLDDIAGFDLEPAVFEDAPPASYRLARLWAVASDGTRYPLTAWAEPESVTRLEKALERALRRQL